jgi:hypothetical protein
MSGPIWALTGALLFAQSPSGATPSGAVTGACHVSPIVRDLDAALAGLRSAGGAVVSSGGVPVSMTFNTRPWRLAIASDPNNLFLIVQQPPTAAPRP